MWECLAVRGLALRTLRHSSAVLGDNIYVYGGLLNRNPSSDLMVLNTGLQNPAFKSMTSSFFLAVVVCFLCVTMTSFLLVALTWTPVKTSGQLPPAL